MTRDELIKSPEYWLQQLQLDLCQMVERYIEKKGITRSEFARQLGTSRSYVSQLLGGDFDSKLSKLVELSLACGMLPSLKFTPMDEAERACLSAYYKAESNIYSPRSIYTAALKQRPFKTRAQVWGSMTRLTNKTA